MNLREDLAIRYEPLVHTVQPKTHDRKDRGNMFVASRWRCAAPLTRHPNASICLSINSAYPSAVGGERDGSG
jgi:hypothetical protein